MYSPSWSSSSSVSNHNKRIALYLRVSTTEQMTEGYGLESQEQSIRAYAETEYPDAVITVYKESHTGSEIRRPELDKLLYAVKRKQYDAVIVWKIDRVSRTVKDLVNIIDVFLKYDVVFQSVQERADFQSQMGRLMYYQLSNMAEMERHNILNRTLSGKITSARLGNFTGSWAPYGYQKIPNPHARKGSVLEIVPHQATHVREIYKKYVYEAFSGERIAEWMNEQNIPYDPQGRTSREGKWSEEIIYRLLKNAIYQGTHVANKKDTMGRTLPQEKWTVVDTPIIVDSFLWHQAQEVSKGRRKYHGKDIYLLSGKIHDSSLPEQRKFIGIRRTKGGISYRRKQYHGEDGNYNPTFEIPGLPLEAYVWELVKDALMQPAAFYKAYCDTKQKQHEKEEQNLQTQDDLKKITKQIDIIQSQEIPRIQTAYEKGIYDEEQTKQRMQTKRTELSHLQGQQESYKTNQNTDQKLNKEYRCLKQLSTHYTHALEKLTQAQKKALCDMLIENLSLTRQRTPDEKKWHIQGRIVMRFNLAKENLLQDRGRTSKDPLNEKDRVLCKKSCEVGETTDLGYSKSNKFSFNFVFQKEWISTNGKGIWKSAFVDLKSK